MKNGNLTLRGRLGRRQILAAALAFGALGTQAVAVEIVVTDVGAVSDGKTLNTKALQSAIDTCTAAGGGRVLVPAGQFLTGGLVLKDHVTLDLEAGAVLLGSTRLEDYEQHTPKLRSYTDVNYVDRSLIYAENARNIAITGRGVIDGQGDAESFQNKPYKQRPYLMRIIGCQNVLVKNITLKDSAMWVQHYLGCTDVLIDGVTVDSLVNANNDGIDIDSCERMRVANCDIASIDDSIVLKATMPRPCKHIAVTNCNLMSRCNALKCGTESTGGFEDIAITNCTIYDTRLSGIALEAVDGGSLRRVLISGISMVNTSNPLFIRLGDRARPYLADYKAFKRGEVVPPQPRPPVAELHDVVIRDVVAKGANIFGCAIAGIPGHPVREIHLSNIHITTVGGGTKDLIDRDVPEPNAVYPEFNMFGRLPAYGLFFRHAEGISLNNVLIDCDTPDARPAVVMDDVRSADITALRAGSKGGERLVLRTSA
ncbi:MAG: hypothetical protein IT425_02025, partial [Pirellulales bacterium]|nr:hypothetical protein [Pirellulales bacterium]